MIEKPIAWSHSRIETFKKCRRQFYEMNVAKSVKFEQSDAMKAGDVVHKLLDKRVSQNVPFPQGYEYLEPLAKGIISIPGQTFTERQFTLTQNLTPTGWFASDAWVRASADVMKLQPEKRFGWIGDYKTGKMNFDEAQLKLYAAVGFHHFPEIDTWRTSYIWISAKLPNGETYHRSQLPDMWRALLVTPMELQRANAANDWPPRPGRHCRWCLVNKYGRCPEAAERFDG